MLIDQLRRPFPPQQERKRIKPRHDALQLHALHEEDRHRQLGAPNGIQKVILEGERPGSHAFLPCYSSSSRFSPMPRAFSFRCSAERSMPMNDAVREMLPENLRIWIRSEERRVGKECRSRW